MILPATEIARRDVELVSGGEPHHHAPRAIAEGAQRPVVPSVPAIGSCALSASDQDGRRASLTRVDNRTTLRAIGPSGEGPGRGVIARPKVQRTGCRGWRVLSAWELAGWMVALTGRPGRHRAISWMRLQRTR